MAALSSSSSVITGKVLQIYSVAYSIPKMLRCFHERVINTNINLYQQPALPPSPPAPAMEKMSVQSAAPQVAHSHLTLSKYLVYQFAVIDVNSQPSSSDYILLADLQAGQVRVLLENLKIPQLITPFENNHVDGALLDLIESPEDIVDIDNSLVRVIYARKFFNILKSWTDNGRRIPSSILTPSQPSSLASATPVKVISCFLLTNASWGVKFIVMIFQFDRTDSEETSSPRTPSVLQADTVL